MSVAIAINSMKHGASIPERILQLLQGLIVDAVHAVVDKGAAQEHSQGKDPQVILGVLLESMLESEWFKKRQRNQRSNCQHPLDHGKSKRVPEKHLFLLY